LMPGPEIEYQRRVNRAVFDMVNGCQSFGVKIVRIIKPLHAVQWRRLKRTSMSVTSNEQGIEVVSQSVFNLPKLGFFPLPGELRKLTYLIKAADLLVSHMPNGGALASILSSKTGIPFVHCVHGTDLLDIQFLRAVRSSSKGLFARSHAIAKQLKNKQIECEGICFSGISKDWVLNDLGQKKFDPCHLITVCDLIPLKNIDVVLFALAQLTSEFDWTYTVIGDGPQRAALESMISDLGLEDRVSLLGRRSRDEVIKLMDDASIFVMPSAPESMGMAYLEAMARGCIVVGAVGWGIDGVVHDGINGFLTSPRDVASCTQAIQRAFNANFSVRESSLETVKTSFTENNSFKNYAKLLRDAVDGKSREEVVKVT